MIVETVQSRVLGALRPVHGATGARVGGGLVVAARVAGERASVRPNRSGLWVIHQALGLESHAASFEAPPAEPAVGSVDAVVEVSDPAGRFLPRSLVLPLPRDPAPDAPAATSLFVPVDLPLFASPSSPTDRGWALVRLALRGQASGLPLGGALVEVLRASDDELLARGLSEWRGATAGEALVPVAGIPVATWALEPSEPPLDDVDDADDADDDEEEDDEDDSVMVHQVPARLVVRGGRFGDRPVDLPSPDPDELADAAPRTLVGEAPELELRSGHTRRLTVVVEEP
jgi:hypothetical protein